LGTPFTQLGTPLTQLGTPLTQLGTPLTQLVADFRGSTLAYVYDVVTGTFFKNEEKTQRI
jgi:hypothetical protein